MTMPSGARLAVLIPTKQRPASLEATLAKVLISARALAADLVEIVVCDQSHVALPPRAGVRILHRPELSGLPAARNVLLRACTAPVVCFIDDDTDLADDFLLRLLSLVVEEPEMVAWGPAIEARAAWTRRLHRLVHLGALHDPRRLLPGPSDRRTTVLFGCCFAVRRDLALQVGFDQRRRGYALGEDLDFFLRLGALTGPGRVRFATALVAHHRRDGANRADAVARGRAKARFLLWLARRHGQRNPATLIHLAVALLAAASGHGQESGSWRGVVPGLLHAEGHG